MRGSWQTLLAVSAIAWSAAAVAATLNHPAENQVPVVMTQVDSSAGETIVTLQVQVALKSVCWAQAGPNSPYLLSNGVRYRLTGSDNVTYCPIRRDYAASETMRLRFQPLPAQADEFSLVEGEGGENQLIDPVASTGRYWNFLHVRLR